MIILPKMRENENAWEHMLKQLAQQLCIMIF
jgi:hypothetical protein